MQSIRHIIAVASGKGGVGKSTVTVNLALALAADGARVGLLDADIYGPSQPTMLGLPAGTRPDTEDDKWLLPVPAQGLATMSMGYLANERTPMVWRGPMAGGALAQMLEQTRWGELDYLLIDMPPGTGDIQLTLAQKAKLAGAVIVTTPQDIALLDARKGIEMFRKVDVPVLGIIENMALHRCSQCGHVEHIFGEGGGERVAEEYGVQLLGSLPLTAAVRAETDAGRPTVASAPGSDAGEAFIAAARALRAVVETGEDDGGAGPTISITDD
ncbi:iron-sulfur cluster carrier protein ApbC [Pseudohaliea rubra]|uniref:Iron-sulfur cluster carrier protein n=1 Tax=Pseudohaliea rubra DSM 19751 TaxID=1265313 RepID=A0A095XZR7_9GAMM|nr:iron-sulfur cluster carrier protein ApbC [Pseudohaliea rubra]KGE05271.1 Scaffold protein for [4Fe-4S] cluster assembly ApbC, MRP-like type [Pseudohaliea rubra DSM 19751]